MTDLKTLKITEGAAPTDEELQAEAEAWGCKDYAELCARMYAADQEYEDDKITDDDYANQTGT